MRSPLALGIAAALAVGLAAPEAGAQSMRTVTKVRSLQGEKDLDVSVVYGAGTMEISRAEPGILYKARLRYDEEVFEPVTRVDGNVVRLGVHSTKDFSVRSLKSHSDGEFDLELARDVPMRLTLEFGAVEADIDLGGISMEELEVATGASKTHLEVSRPNPVRARRAEISVGAASFVAEGLGNLNARRIRVQGGIGDINLSFDGAWEEEGEVDVEMGLGSVRLTFPEELGVRIERDTFLTSFDPEGLTKHGDSYTSPGWDEAERRVTVHLSGALGAVNVRWMR